MNAALEIKNWVNIVPNWFIDDLLDSECPEPYCFQFSSRKYSVYCAFENVIHGDDSDYAEPSFTSKETTFEWFHPVSEVIEALIGAGLVIERFREYPFITYRARRGMVQGDDGLWRLPPNVIALPLKTNGLD